MLFLYKNGGVGGLTSTALLLIHFHIPPSPNKKITKTPLLGYDCKICCACVKLLHKLIIDGMQ